MNSRPMAPLNAEKRGICGALTITEMHFARDVATLKRFRL